MLSNIFYLSFLCLSIFRTDCVNKYCSSNVCNNTKQHTLCRFQSTEPARQCLDYERTVNSNRDKRLLLEKINARRNKVASGEIRSLPPAEDMLIMEWREELAESAQRWADQCVTHKHSVGEVHDACRDLVDVEVGQNIATVYGEAPGLTPMSLVDVWYMELLNIKPGIISRYTTITHREETCMHPLSNSTMCVKTPHHTQSAGKPRTVSSRSNFTGTSSYKYFSQLVWADTYQVGCGGVKFKERYDDSDDKKNRTVYRLVCNFAPRGNQVGKAVYSAGPTGAKCIYGTNKNYTSLCDTKPIDDEDNDELVDESQDSNYTIDNSDTDATSKHETTLKSEVFEMADLNADDDNTTFDYISHLYELTKDHLISTTTTKPMCNKELAVEEIVEILKKKLSSDPTLQQLFTTTLPVSTGSVFKDASVAAFLDKIYNKAVLSTTTETPNADFVNSTLLVNLVEAVIFRNTDTFQASDKVTQEQLRPFNFVHPIAVQAEVVTTKPNYDVTGHYFFPEDDIEEAVRETTEPDYDMSYAPSMQDVVLEIEELRKNKPTRDFLYDILETESVVESTTKFKLLSPDDMNLHTSGYSNMKSFLKEIDRRQGRK